ATLVHAKRDEELMLIYNEIFVGLVRESAQIPRSALRMHSLSNLLRQAVVAACTALDTYLPSLLRASLPTVIEARGRDFLPQDASLEEYFKDLTFSLSETLRLLDDPSAPLFIANKILAHSSFKYLSSRKGVHAVGALLGLEKPWDEIASKLRREKKELMQVLDETARRRNDIVHRADRQQSDPDGEVQEISYVWAMQAVDTVKHVCLTLDTLVAERVEQLRLEAHPAQEVAAVS
ncbi:MAG TPA: hypothetical protein VFS83_05300, partial [Ktedonobacterales bacterium]|nr:hypothetical protein [Ktedonobacterales bacterium]